ncbi:fluoride efflux transporter FluC [Agreia sp.]|uniref:fluoride efflux transporter FluC n=1 Tax=Agreia sp. TaxID=1872416 RepID=UPI0035BC6EC1
MKNRLPTHLVAVFLGGIVGTALRLALDEVVPHADEQFPASTLVINVIGSFVLGWLTGGLFSRDVSTVVKAAIGPGVLGSFTTFSAVILALVLLAASSPSQVVLAVIYLAATLLLGFGAAFVGLRVGARGAGPRCDDPRRDTNAEVAE